MSFKLKVTNKSKYPVERFQFKFQPGETQEIEVNTADERLAIAAVVVLEVEEILPPKSPKKAKVEKKEEAPTSEVTEVEDKGDAKEVK